MVIQAKQFVVRGRVQGVGFRWFTQRSAQRHGIAGWVKNLPDGQVAILASGSDTALQWFERDVRTGPPGARVEDVTITDVDDLRETSGFVVE